MRKIKFRIWDKKYSTFDYNDSPDVFIGTDGKVYDREEHTLGDLRDVEYIESDNYVISQFTGLHDKNGKEIYEGDIVNFINTQTKHKRWEVSFSRAQFILLASSTYVSLSNTDLDFVEVIGNIHENPELLKEEVK